MEKQEKTKATQHRTKAPTSFRLSATALSILAALADEMGQSQTGVIELALRDLAKSRSVAVEAKK